MRTIFFLLCLIPLTLFAQTAHVEDGRVVYRQRLTVNGVDERELYRRAEAALRTMDLRIDSTDAGKGLLVVRDRMRLSGRHSLRNTMTYELRLQARKDGYEYRIDSVAWIRDARGEKIDTMPSKKIVDNMEVTGPTAAAAEKQLNEMDMRLQELIARLDRLLRKPSTD